MFNTYLNNSDARKVERLKKRNPILFKILDESSGMFSFCDHHTHPDDSLCVVLVSVGGSDDFIDDSNVAYVDELYAAEDWNPVPIQRHIGFYNWNRYCFDAADSDIDLIQEETWEEEYHNLEVFVDLAENLEAYPLLDEEDYSRRVHDAEYEEFEWQSRQIHDSFTDMHPKWVDVYQDYFQTYGGYWEPGYVDPDKVKEVWDEHTK